MRLCPLAAVCLFTLTSTAAQAAIVFQFGSSGQAGSDLKGLQTGTSTATDGTVTLTLNAAAFAEGVAFGNVEFGQFSGGFGIDTNKLGESGAQFDDGSDGSGDESAQFWITSSSVPLSSLRLRSVTWSGVGVSGGIADVWSIQFNGDASSTIYGSQAPVTTFNGETTIDRELGLNQSFSLAYVDGNSSGASGGFSLEAITFEATAVPEPSTLALLSLTTLTAFGYRLRRQKHGAIPTQRSAHKKSRPPGSAF